MEKAAALFHSLIANHPFHNGNKRTAVLSVDAFLIGNGFTITLDNDAMYELAQDTASYRERGVGHVQQLAIITGKLKQFTVEIEMLRTARISNPEMRKKLKEFYRRHVTTRRSVRRNPFNNLINPDRT